MKSLNDKIQSFYPAYILNSYDKDFDSDYRKRIDSEGETREFNDWVKKCGEEKLLNVPPMFYQPFKEEYILSVGLNPSLTNTFFKLLPYKTNEKCCDASQIEELISFQQGLKFGANAIPYFKQQNSFFSELLGSENLHQKPDLELIKKSVFHYDLVQLRHTYASGVLKRLLNENDAELKKHVIIHLEFVLDTLKPKVIFVFNAAVSRFFIQEGIATTKEFDQEKGCYHYNDIPLICANQLSGGATSSFYRELLLWNSRRILNLIKAK